MPPSYFAFETLHHRKRNRSCVCNSCNGGCLCISCGSWKPKTQFRSGVAECKSCQPLKCAACGKHKLPKEFTPHMRNNYVSHKQNVVCNVCSAEGKKARAGAHRERSMSGQLKVCSQCSVDKPLVMFRVVKGVRAEQCFSCEVVPCAVCHTDVQAQRFSQSQLNNFFTKKTPMLCSGCTDAGCTARDLQRYICTECGESLGHRMFNAKQLNNFKERGGVLLCQRCQSTTEEADTTRERSLRAKAARSKRKRCTCNRRLGHSETCPMHIRYSGEKTFPWCDVMTQHDSTWFQARFKKQRVQA